MLLKRLASRLFGTRNTGSDTVIIKVRIDGNHTYYYPFKARAGMKVREMNADEFQSYLAVR